MKKRVSETFDIYGVSTQLFAFTEEKKRTSAQTSHGLHVAKL
jgi:hypothetical protein